MESRQERAAQRLFERQRAVLYRWISLILGIGFWTSVALIVAGIALAAVLREPLGDDVAPLPDVIPEALDLNPQGILDLGIVVLLLTPAAYVAVSLVIFLRQRDRLFVIVCCVLLALTMISIGVGLR